MDKPNRDSYTSTNFLEWRESQTLAISPKFQRRSVWKLPQKSYLIDTLLRQMPVPPIYLRNKYDAKKRKVVREVIDGQQRIRAVMDYIDGQFALSKGLKSQYSRKKFGALPEVQQAEILKYRFICETFDDISDQEVLEVFSRLNMYSIPLNRQELRNGRYFGQFKQACYDLALGHLEMWRAWNLFTETKIARMQEVQLTSALLVAQLVGMQDKNDSIDDFYEANEDEFPKKSMHEDRFRAVMDEMTNIFGHSLAETQFKNPAFFYTLYCGLYHRIYELPGFDRPTPKKRVSVDESEGIKAAVDKLSGVISAARKQQQLIRSTDLSDDAPRRRNPIPVKYRDFATACLSGTDNIAPRKKRLETLYDEAFG